MPILQQAEFKRVHPNAEYNLNDFRKEAVSWLGGQFGGDLDVTSSKKVLKVTASGNRRSADILLVAPHKTYQWYQSERPEDQSFVEGVLFITSDGTPTVNYPKQHSDNMTGKHQASISPPFAYTRTSATAWWKLDISGQE